MGRAALALLCGLAAACVASAAMPDRPHFHPLDPSLDAWGQLKDRHRGERCLYVGNGPSLNRVDFQRHVNPSFSVVMGANKIYMGFERFQFRPNYYAAANAKVLQQAAAEIISMPNEMVKFLRSDRWDMSAEMNRENNVVLFHSISQCKDGGLTCKVLGEDNPEACLRNCDNCFCDASKYVVEGNTITYMSMQILFYLGCRDIVVIGVDHSFQQSGKPNSAQVMDGPDPNHFDPAYFGGQKWDLADLASSERHYEIARQHFVSHCGRVTDATDRGKLAIFPKAPLSTVAPPLMTVVAVLEPFDTMQAAWSQGLAMRTWRQLDSRPRIVVFARDAAGAALATALHLEVYPVVDYMELVGLAHASVDQQETVSELLTSNDPEMLLFVVHPGTLLPQEYSAAVQMMLPDDMDGTAADVPMIAQDVALMAQPAATTDRCRDEATQLLSTLLRETKSSGLRHTPAGGSVVSAALVMFRASLPVDFNSYAPGDGSWLLREIAAVGGVVGDSSSVPALAIGPMPTPTLAQKLHGKSDATCSLALVASGLLLMAGLAFLAREISRRSFSSKGQ